MSKSSRVFVKKLKEYLGPEPSLVSTMWKPTILLVDDDPIFIRGLMAVLHDMGTLYYASNGTAALTKARDKQPDIILLDAQMPGMNGFDTCKALKTNPSTKAATIIFVTARIDIESEARGLEMGAIDFIHKPISPPLVRIRIQNHLRLKIQELQLKTALETSIDGFWMTDTHGRLLEVNDSYQRISGFSRTELLSMSISDLEATESHDEMLRHIQKVIRDGNSRFESRHRRKDGSEFNVEISASFSPIADGLLFVFSRDITERLRAEDNLKEARLSAEEASRAKSDFLASMSHEIRTPMNGVLGMADLILKTRLSEKQRHYIEILHRSGRTLLRIIDDILDFSRIQAGALSLESLKFDLHEVLSDINTIFSEKSNGKGLVLGFNIDEGVAIHLVGDSYRLGQILYNLVGNAIKFTKKGSVVVSVVAREASDDHQLLFFQVTDTGIGISPAFQKKIFHAFSQEDPSITRRFGGTGLGLAITNKLVAMMGGQLGLESQTGHGATFWFTIRFKKQRIESTEGTALKPNFQQPLTLGKSRFDAHILIVEDNQTNQEVIIAVLDIFGCQTTVANDGQEALNIFRDAEPPFDAILMDCEMPVLDGMETSRRIREMERLAGNRHTPIIALTAHVSSETQAQCIDAGMDDYLRKPLNFNRLNEILLHYLPKKQIMEEEGSSSALSGDAFSNSVLDQAVLDSILSLGKESGTFPLEKIINSYVRQTPELLGELKNAIEQKDAEKVRRTAHTLKSSSLTVGVIRLAELADGMETDFQNLALVRGYFRKTAAAFEEAKQALNNLVLHQKRLRR